MQGTIRAADTMILRFLQHKVFIMSKKTSFPILTLLALLAATPLIGACHTTAGAGEDISKTGAAIEHTADKAAP
jgi:predicted small secreted protein